jgi:signal transduction histidine kinase
MLLAILSAAPSGAQVRDPKVVLLLYAAAGLPPAPNSVDTDIRATLQAGAGGPIQVYTELVDLSWAASEQYEGRLATLLRDKYASQKIDIIVSVSAPALRFLMKHRSDVFPGLPVVFCGVEAAAVDGDHLGPDIGGIRTHPDWGATLEAALALHPGTSRVDIVSGTSDLDRAMRAAAAREFARYRDRVELRYLDDEPMERLAAAAASLPKGTLVFYVSMLRDAAGRRFNGADALTLLAQASSAPIYGASEAYLGHGIVGGRLSGYSAHGVKAGELALRVLRGEPPKSLPILDEEATAFMFDGRQLRRWGISESRLPPGSVVRYDEASVWARHRWQLIIGSGLALSGALLAIGVLLQRTGRKRAEALLAERLNFESLLAELSAGLIHVVAGELDAAIAREIRRVAEFLGVDRASLHEYLPARPPSRIAWAREGIDPLPWALQRSQLPWTIGQIEGARDVRFSRIDELPVAVMDRQSYEAAGTRSCLVRPLRNGGPILGALFLESVRGERTWPDGAVLERLGLLGEVFAGVLERKRVELSLDEQLRFEVLLSEQSAAFSRVSAADVDREIDQALRRTVNFLGVDRGSLAELSPDGLATHVTHSWAKAGTEPPLPALVLAELPWVESQLRAGAVVCFARVADLPEREAAVDRRTYARLGIASHIEVPLTSRGVLGGVLVFSTLRDERAWRDELVQRLRLLGEVFANVLSRRRADAEVRRLREELAHVGRVSTIGELTASLAHELGQPLTAILNNAEAARHLLKSGAASLGELQAILDDIIADDERASEVIDRLRGLLKRGPLERAPLDLNEITREVARLVRGDAVARGVAIRLDLAPGLPLVRGDRVELQQVLLNLILNGLDAMRETSSEERVLVLQTVPEGAAGVRVIVRDTGSGIDPGRLDRVFDAFHTTKPQGLGMGLAIARSIVEAHGGRLKAQNNPGRGATFTFAVTGGARPA